MRTKCLSTETEWRMSDDVTDSREGTVREILSADVDSVQIPFGATVGDVTPELGDVNLPQLCEPFQHAHLPRDMITIVGTIGVELRKDASGHHSCFR